jgi:hypothetical protein
MDMNTRRKFLLAAAIILLTTGIVKLVSAGGEARSLNLRDPLLYLSNRQVFLAVGGLELALAGYLIFGKNSQVQILALAWLTTNFAAYRLAVGWGDIAKPCGCLGNAMDWFPWLMKHQDSVMKGLLTFMLIGAYGFLWNDRKILDQRKEEVQKAARN